WVAPDTWKDNGGSIGSIQVYGGRLIIVQTWSNHRAIRRLLAQLSEPEPPSHVPADTSAVELWNDEAGEWVSQDPASAERALDRPIDDLRFTDEPLDSALWQLRQR